RLPPIPIPDEEEVPAGRDRPAKTSIQARQPSLRVVLQVGPRDEVRRERVDRLDLPEPLGELPDGEIPVVVLHVDRKNEPSGRAGPVRVRQPLRQMPVEERPEPDGRTDPPGPGV